MTCGAGDTRWDEAGVRRKCLADTQRLQSGSPYTSNLSSLRLGRAAIYGQPLLGQAAELSTVLKGPRGRLRPRRVTRVTQGLRLAKRCNWDSNSTWTSCCFWIQFPTDIIQILFLSCWSQRGKWQNVECLLSMFQRFTDGVSLEQFSITKGLLLKDALSFCLYYCCYCLFSLISSTAPIISDCLFFMRRTPHWKIRKQYFLKTWSFLQAVVQSLSHVWCVATLWTAACWVSLSFTISQSLLKLMSIKLVIPSNHLIICCPPLLLPSVFPSIRVFSNKLVLCIGWPKYGSFSVSISPFNGYSGLISFRIDWLYLLAIHGTLKSLLQHHSSKASILCCSAFFMVQFSHPYLKSSGPQEASLRTQLVEVIGFQLSYLKS